EVLAVGDEAFTRKCLDKISEFHRRGRTIVIVTHALGLVEKMCDDVLWLRHGRVADRGDPKRVIDAYLTYVAGGEEALLRAGPAPPVEPRPAPPGPEGANPAAGAERAGRWGSREVEITRVRLRDAAGKERHVYAPGETMRLSLTVRAAAPVADFVFGLGLFTANGTSVYGTNTDLEGFAPRRLAGAAEGTLTLRDLRLVEGTYVVDVAAPRRDGTPYDYHRALYTFRVKSHTKDVGVYRPQHEWSFAGPVEIEEPPARPEL